jgi:hypothetical protein
MAHQNRAADDPARSGVHHDHSSFSNRACMTDTRHVPASTGTLLDAGDAGMPCGPGGTRMGRFRESSGGQTDYQQEVEGTLQELSVHRVFPLETMAI